ncbi:protein FAM151A [Salarias fasciatus]|uniref:protein FAM151A n=1 Tax=Salarias fasciatus TaxID=181472 RepID=UPI0011765907|nr:protein FAM151A [Salarias fasciatus]
MAKKYLVLAAAAVGVALLAGIISACVLLIGGESDSPAAVPVFSTGGDMLDYLKQMGHIGETDGLLATWFHRANNKSEMNKALTTPVMILEADITLEGYGTVNQSLVPIMAHPPDIYSDNTLDQWLDAVLSSDKGIKLDFKSLESVGPSLDLLNEKNNRTRINRPVWVNADIVQGPNVPNFLPAINGTRFLEVVQEKFWDVTLSPGWKATYLPPILVGTYTRTMVEEMYELVKDVPQKVTFPVHAMMVRSGWQHISWILSQSSNYSLTLWQGSIHPPLDDLLFVRDNSHPARVYYDIYEPTLTQFKGAARSQNRVRRFYPGGDLMDFLHPAQHLEDSFLSGRPDSLAVSWFTVTDGSSLSARLADEVGGMLVLHVAPHGEKPRFPVVQRSGSQPLTLEEVLQTLGQHPKAPWGIYLRVHSYEVLEDSLDLLRSAYTTERLYRPVWISVEDPNSSNSTEDFVSTVERLFPYVTLVLAEQTWPSVVPPAVSGLSQRVALHLDTAAVLGGETQRRSLTQLMDRYHFILEWKEESRAGDLAVLKALRDQHSGRDDAKLYVMSEES